MNRIIDLQLQYKQAYIQIKNRQVIKQQVVSSTPQQPQPQQQKPQGYLQVLQNKLENKGGQKNPDALKLFLQQYSSQQQLYEGGRNYISQPLSQQPSGQNSHRQMQQPVPQQQMVLRDYNQHVTTGFVESPYNIYRSANGGTSTALASDRSQYSQHPLTSLSSHHSVGQAIGPFESRGSQKGQVGQQKKKSKSKGKAPKTQSSRSAVALPELGRK